MRFEDFPAAAGEEPFRPVTPLLATPEARLEGAELKREAEAGPNFAGHFRLALLDCGSCCREVSLVDVRSGEVRWAFRAWCGEASPGRPAERVGLDFRKESALLVVQGAPEEAGRNRVLCFRWTGQRLELLRADDPAAGRGGFAVPASPWLLELSTAGLELKKAQYRDDGGGYFVLAGGDVTISFFLDRERDCSSGRACRDRLWASREPKLKTARGVKRWERGDLGLLAFEVAGPQEAGGVQRHLYAQYVCDGAWADIHLAATGGASGAAPDSLLESLLESIAFPGKPAAPPARN